MLLESILSVPQDSLVLSGDGHLLLAVNAGSSEISVFKVIDDRLILRDRVSSRGLFPNSVALFGDLVYVLNAKGSSPHINGFRLDPDGVLHAIDGARVQLAAWKRGTERHSICQRRHKAVDQCLRNESDSCLQSCS